mmetsp:Transcript_55884/g.149614  ORF Transcript_55884/g.149614 Transcript_55884/m.149614 type:complete len:292 (-) Transcript_55884:102-977(-)
MAPLTEAAKESMWFRSLGFMMKGKEDEGCVCPEKVGDVPEEPRQRCCFDFADLLEEGLGPGPTSSYTEVPRPGQLMSLFVQRVTQRNEYQLTDEDGRPLLVACSNPDGTEYEMFATSDNSPRSRSLGPSFILKSDPSREQWSLHSVRCEQCESRGKRQCGSRVLARLNHYCENVGEGQAFCMDLEVPKLGEDGTSAIFCPLCGDASEEDVVELTTRRPKWNLKHRSLTLDFNGRCSMASAKNFMLEDAGKPGGKYSFLFGKVKENQFVLDYRYPLGPVQAFAAALSASHWN